MLTRGLEKGRSKALLKQQGWSLADAEAEMQSFGFNDVWVNFKKFIRRYGAEPAKK